MEYAWIIWLVIAAVLIAGEVMTTGFVLLWFGIGAVVASVLALLGVTSVSVQIITFLIVSVVLVLASRTILEDWFKSKSSTGDLKMGAERMLGQTGVVVEASRGPLLEAAVKVDGTVWTAYPVEGSASLENNETVQIERIEGNSIYVRSTRRPSPMFGERPNAN
jgi:membrane protein implicated in regulation of membrane protease activity